ncbi:hypothetical protein S2091_1494 [Solimicrobium silvestre]|uniref:Uncharacterized protein n=1 Tax=Solimicrobium silvestre TaxID=2099400 RepID=A0A2S9H1L8_9BURK|nr:hypothetical protein S2091_1494 [Solimicrobium silvestre]
MGCLPYFEEYRLEHLLFSETIPNYTKKISYFKLIDKLK